jgi:hypothetical protein
MIVYAKRIDGHVLHVEQVRTGRKTLTATTMHQQKLGEEQ